MSLKKYLTLTRAGMIEALQFRISIVVTILGNIIYLIIAYFLWKAIYASVESATINGMTFEDTMIYLVLASALFYFMEVYLVWNMGRNIQSGKIILDLLKPMQYESFMFWQSTGNLLMSFFTTFIPTIIIVYIVTNGAIHIGINLLFFVIAVIFALLINYYIDFFVGTICIHTESIWGVNIMKEVTIALLSGASIPIAFFPEPLKTFALNLPFQAIYNTPLRLLISPSMPNAERLRLLMIQVVWIAVLYIISKLFWSFSLKKITVNGG